MNLSSSPDPVSPRPADPLAAFPKITPEQYATFDALTSGHYSNFLLMSVHLSGKPTVAICAVTEPTEGENLDVTPLYVAVTDDLFALLTPPPLSDGTEPEVVAP